tara:strand:- start:1646 stop:2335 length:690 start_codon:yes stop_codon:yes gene_type:complete
MDEIIKNKNIYIQYDSNLFDNFSNKLFNIDYISKEGLIKSVMGGRGKALELQYEGKNYFWKHYIRGGLVAKISYDRYMFNSLASTRAVKEYNFLNTMNDKGLPVPKAAALQVITNRFTYKADLITCKIENKGTLFDFVKNNKMNNDLWNKLSITLEKFYNENVYHSDLNSKNIIIDKDNNIFLLDFDNSYFFYNKKLFNKSISRLERSLNKIDNYNNEFKITVEKFSNL